MRKFIHPGQPIGLSLTAKERHLLVKDCLVIDNTYLDRIREAPAEKPQVPFTLDELDDLAGSVAVEAHHAKSKTKQKALEMICGKIQHLLETHTDEQEPEGGPADSGGKTAIAAALSPLHLMMAEFEAMGLDLETLAKKLTPQGVAPEEPIPVSMSAAEKELVLTLAGISEEIRERIRQTPSKKRTVALTLREVNELQPLVTGAENTCPDKKLARKWGSIRYHLHDMQMRYSDGTEPSDAFEQALAGQPVSSVAAVRGLLRRMMEERKKGPP